MHKLYVPRSATTKAIDKCRSAIVQHHGSKVDVGVDLIGTYLELPDETTFLMAERWFAAYQKDAARS